MDLESAEYLQEKRPQPREIICCHAQQSAEKKLKGHLIYKGVAEPPKTHNLIILNNICFSFDELFCNIDKACSILTGYGTSLSARNRNNGK